MVGRCGTIPALVAASRAQELFTRSSKTVSLRKYLLYSSSDDLFEHFHEVRAELLAGVGATEAVLGGSLQAARSCPTFRVFLERVDSLGRREPGDLDRAAVLY